MNLDKNDSFFSIGEFAQLCNTTRDTLYHYEKRGLLQPSVNEQNGYRYYTAPNFYTFMFIAHLTRIGFSLGEVKIYLEEHNIENYISSLKTSERRYYEEKERNQLRNERTQRGLRALLKMMNKPLNLPQITYMDEEYFLRFPFDGDFSGKSCVECQSKHIKYAAAHSIDIQRHFLGFYMKNAFTKEEQRFDSVITQMVSRVDCDHLFVKPAGMYLTMAYRGPYDEGQAASYDIVRQYLDKHSFTPLAGMFVVEAIGPFFSDRKNEYVSELSVLIE